MWGRARFGAGAAAISHPTWTFTSGRNGQQPHSSSYVGSRLAATHAQTHAPGWHYHFRFPIAVELTDLRGHARQLLLLQVLLYVQTKLLLQFVQAAPLAAEVP